MTTVRFATAADTLRVVRGLQNKGMNFNTTAQAKADILAGHLLVAEIDGRIVGSLAVVPTAHGYTGLKRGCVYNKKNQGKGVLSAMFDFALSLGLGDYGCTPWIENTAVIHSLEKRGFHYEKTVCENYLVYVRKACI